MNRKLCPVCKKNRLKGKQRACSSACRSAKYREARKHREESVRRVVCPRRREPPQAAPQGLQERLLTIEEMVRAAVAELRAQPHRSATPTRIDMREQVLAQAPKGAMGYRLVLPHCDGSLPPRLTPRRSHAAPRAAYSLIPFEYPDDLRLRDGCWYQIVWTDSQGSRIRRGSEQIPGLCFVIGPCGSTSAGYQGKER